MIAISFTARAQTDWSVVTGDWATVTNWTNGVPDSKTAAFIANNGTATVSSLETEAALSLNLGGSATTGGFGGAGTLDLMGGGTLTLTSVIAIGGNGSDGNNQGGSGGAGGSGTLNLSGNLSLSSGNMLLGGNGGNGGNGGSSLPGGSGGIGGNGALKLSGGSLMLSSGNIIVGGTDGINGTGGTGGPGGTGGMGGTGTLNLDSGTVTAKTIVVGGNGVVNFGPAAGQTVTVNADMRGLSSRTVSFSTPGTVVLNGSTDFGGVTIGAGATLEFRGGGSDAGAPLGTGPITNNGSLVVNDVDYYTGVLPNKITGTGSVTVAQSQWMFYGTATYSGTTTLNGSWLIAQNVGALSGKSAFIVNAGSTLDLNGYSCNIGSLSGVGLVTSNSNAGPIGYLKIGDTNTSTTFSGEISDGSAVSDGSGLGIDKVGTGTLILTGSNVISWGVSISAGTLQIGNGGTTGSIDSTVPPMYAHAPLVDNGTLVFDRSDALNFGYTIEGTGNVVQEGAGTTTLNGNDGAGDQQNYSGTTTVSAGTLQAGSTSGFSPNSAFTVDTGATLDLNGFNNTVGSLAGSGTVTNNGTMAAILTIGNNGTSTTFSGNLVDGTSSLGLTKIGAG
ncbi:MAG: autotransporter-associated beta strand repeat-containing protein, partial [Verrucomicrobia bacterium]|nr:autotransporter-associated beta strand repeat-containing protein [Verrucomicrobiota bacterium]